MWHSSGGSHGSSEHRGWQGDFNSLQVKTPMIKSCRTDNDINDIVDPKSNMHTLTIDPRQRNSHGFCGIASS